MSIRSDTYIIDAVGGLNIVWGPGLLNGDTGAFVSIGRDYWKLTVQAVGTFGAGGTVVLEGSNDGVTTSTLKDVNNASISMTDNTIQRLEGIPGFIRPRVSAGDGTTNLAIYIHGVI